MAIDLEEIDERFELQRTATVGAILHKLPGLVEGLVEKHLERLPAELGERLPAEIANGLAELRGQRESFTESVLHAVTPVIRRQLTEELAGEVDARVRRDQAAIISALLDGQRRLQLDLTEEAIAKASPALRQVAADALAERVAPLLRTVLKEQVDALALLVKRHPPDIHSTVQVDLSKLEDLISDLGLIIGAVSAKIDNLALAILEMARPKPRSIVMSDAEGRRVEGELR